MAGRKRVPTQLKLMRGTDRPDRTNKREPKPKTGVPQPLPALTPEAMVHFGRLVEQLSAVNVVTTIDGVSLSGLAQSIADYEQATKELATGGKVTTSERGLVKSPWVLIQKQAQDQMQRGFADFGLTPSARAKIVTNPGAPDDEEARFFGS